MIENYKNLTNYLDILFLYENYNHIKKYINNNNIIIDNLNTFITIFKKEFNIEKYETYFIISCLFEYNYYQNALLKKMNIEIFKEIITKRVIETLKDATKESDNLKYKVKACKIKLNNNKNNIDNNYNIIKNLIKYKKTKCNYCYLFDNIKYFNYNKIKKEAYILFISIIFDDYLSSQIN